MRIHFYQEELDHRSRQSDHALYVTDEVDALLKVLSLFQSEYHEMQWSDHGQLARPLLKLILARSKIHVFERLAICF